MPDERSDESPDLRDLRELQQIMKAFAGELNKLEEGLRVLAAYLTRMKSRTPRKDPRSFH